MAITTRDGLVSALAASQRRSYYKIPATAGKGAGSYHSYWTVAGLPAAGAAAGAVNGAVCTDATAGAFPFTNPTAPVLTYLGKFSLATTLGAYFEMYDRLWHNSALSATVTTLQSITHPGLTRYTTGDGVELWVEIYTATTNTTTATIIYTNQAGTGSKSTTVTIPAATLAGQIIPVGLASGDTGVRSVQSVQLAGSMAAGNWGLTQIKPLIEIAVPNNNLGVDRGPFDLGLPQVVDDACLAFLTLLPGTVVPQINGGFDMAQG